TQAHRRGNPQEESRGGAQGGNPGHHPRPNECFGPRSMGEAAMKEEIAWRPTPEYIENAQLTRFMKFCGCASFDELQRESVTQIAWFTERVLKFLDIRWAQPYTEVLNISGGSEWPKWCVEGRLNIVDTCLRHPDDAAAVIYEHESGETRS